MSSDVAGARGAHARRDRGREDLPARAPAGAGRARRGVRWPTSSGAKVTILRFENEAEDLLHYLKDAGVEPGSDGTVGAIDSDQVTIDFGGRAAQLTRSVAETVSVRADPSPPPRTALPEQLVLAKEYGR